MLELPGPKLRTLRVSLRTLGDSQEMLTARRPGSEEGRGSYTGAELLYLTDFLIFPISQFSYFELFREKQRS